MNANEPSPRLAALIGSVCLAATTALAAGPADRAEPLPDELEGIGITERLNNPIPLNLEFTDEDGRPVKLGDYFQPGRPVMLTLNYYRCPMLCSLQLNGLIDGLREMEWVPGQQFEIVTVSFDPRETPTLAKLKKDNYLKEYGRPSAAAGWHFLTGPKASSQALAGAVGFRYRWNEDSKQWMHAAAVFVCTPDGRVSRYLYGVMYDPKTLRLSLVEASEGKIGSAFDQIILFCYHYDAEAGRYAPAAMNFMRAGGGLTVVALGTLLVVLWRRGARRKAGVAGPPPT
jgi:protein SCO1/2